jgi:UDP-N-acetylmuramyl pentapeptide phosphotransferase/UDP-N-acetylglucosamine-1-phosphate transferase
MLLAAGFLAFVTCLILARLLLTRLASIAVDWPNARSLHDRPIPRTGGIAVLAGAAVSLAFGAGELWLPMAIGAALAGVSFLDDVMGVPSQVRLTAHLAAATVLVWYLLSPMNWAEQLLLLLAVTWITNVYNFMDGADGLAAGMGLIGFGAYGVAAWLAQDMAMAVLCTTIAAAASAFLIYNFYPAKIFLGDVGSIPLGFLAAGLGIAGWRNDLWPLWFPLLAFAPFIGDASLTLLKRLAGGQRVWRAHREHYYQRMVRMGFGHRGTACVAYAVMVACAAAAVLARDEAPQTQAMVFGGTTAVLTGLALWVDWRWAKFRRASEATT